MQLKKKTGGATVAGIEWAKDGDVAEVPDELGNELIGIDPDEYEHVPDKAPAKKTAAAAKTDED